MGEKLRLNDFATGPFVRAFTWCASDGKDSSRPPNGPYSLIPGKSFVASMTTFPSSPVTFESASSMAPDGTATSTASASDASPPSGPSSVTSCPAFRQRAASPPPTVPLPTVVILMAQMLPERGGTLRDEWRATGLGGQRQCGEERDESTAGSTDP